MTKIGEHNGHSIELDGRKEFVVTGPLFENTNFGRSYQSYAQAIEEINTRAKRDAKQQTTNVKLPVILPDGKTVATIKGLHSRLGTLLFNEGSVSKQAAERYNSFHDVYPDVSWVKELLVERQKLLDRVAVINKATAKYAIKVSYVYSMNRADYVEQVDKLVADYNEKTAAANAANDRGQEA